MPLAWGKDVERLARALVRQRLDLAYVRHYLMEQFQLDAATVERLLERIGAIKPPDPFAPGKKREPEPSSERDKIRKQGYY
ncbi:MAG: hypothetical protein RMM29_02295 [Planctomycetota bacterium]|nr:hypothetical protein [Planctomycetota bacterium]MCX8040237.1 hypothetical protein [Planctomycetota bacterium]MDW8372468.1 hypothetical protein [Planctomycetota bacterium]